MAKQCLNKNPFTMGWRADEVSFRSKCNDPAKERLEGTTPLKDGRMGSV